MNHLRQSYIYHRADLLTRAALFHFLAENVGLGSPLGRLYMAAAHALEDAAKTLTPIIDALRPPEE